MLESYQIFIEEKNSHTRYDRLDQLYCEQVFSKNKYFGKFFMFFCMSHSKLHKSDTSFSFTLVEFNTNRLVFCICIIHHGSSTKQIELPSVISSEASALYISICGCNHSLFLVYSYKHIKLAKGLYQQVTPRVRGTNPYRRELLR